MLSELRDWLLEPVLVKLSRMELLLMSALDDVNLAIQDQYEAILPALSTVDAELRRMRELLANGASADEVAQVLANVNASTNRIKDAVAAVVASPVTPDPGGELPPVEPEPLPEDVVEV